MTIAGETLATRDGRSSTDARGITGSGSLATRVELQHDAMLRDQMGRVAVFARLVIFLCVFGAAMLPLVDGDPIARNLLLVGLAVAIAASLCLEWLTRRPERYSENRVLVLIQLQEIAALSAAYYFGVFGGFAAIVSLGIYVYGMGASTRNAIISYVTLAGGLAVLAALIISGTIVDRGLVHGNYMAGFEAAVVCVNIQMVYFLALVLGRLSRRKTLEALAQMQETVQIAARREALLEEAREELARAAWIGGPGRFSEQVLGRYKLGVVIGRGAMGEVYEAHDTETGGRAAIKLLQRGHMVQPASIARFTRESRITASLSSPHVARILEVGPASAAVPFLVMEKLEGDDLAAHLRSRSRPNLDWTAAMLREVALGLQAAHDAGIVHRDLKPHNVFHHQPAGERGIWKVLDFGVSKLEGDGDTLTGTGVVGTPGYMAPEQARGGKVDARTDIYALAVIAYRCVTGHPAFRGSDPAAVLYAVVNERPAAPHSLADVPLQVSSVIAIGMATDPAHRFERATDFAEAFGEAASGALSPRWQARADEVLRASPWRGAALAEAA